MAKFIGVDPGKTTGLVICDEDGSNIQWAQMSVPEMVEFTNTFEDDIKMIVVEDFVLFKRRALQQSGSRLHASQVIGMMEVLAAKKGARLIKQPAERKLDGQRRSGLVPKGRHEDNHWVDAYNHLFFRMHEMGIVMSKIEKERLENGTSD